MYFCTKNKKIKDICHRPELVSKLLRKDLDEIIDYKDLVEIAQHENGLKKNVNCKYKVIINKILDSQMNYITISYGGLLSRNAFCVEADFNFYY